MKTALILIDRLEEETESDKISPIAVPSLSSNSVLENVVDRTINSNLTSDNDCESLFLSNGLMFDNKYYLFV